MRKKKANHVGQFSRVPASVVDIRLTFLHASAGTYSSATATTTATTTSASLFSSSYKMVASRRLCRYSVILNEIHLDS